MMHHLFTDGIEIKQHRKFNYFRHFVAGKFLFAASRYFILQVIPVTTFIYNHQCSDSLTQQLILNRGTDLSTKQEFKI